MHTIAFYYNEFPRISISNLTSLLRIVNKGAMPSLIIKRSIHHSMEDTKENYRGKREPPLQEATFIHTLGTPLAYIKITRSMISYTTIRIQTKTCQQNTHYWETKTWIWTSKVCLREGKEWAMGFALENNIVNNSVCSCKWISRSR